MKKMYLLLVILCISLQSLYSVEFDKSKESKMITNNLIALAKSSDYQLTMNGSFSDLSATNYNWERKRIHRPGKFEVYPYPAIKNSLNPDTCIQLKWGGNTPLTIVRTIDITITGDSSAFMFDKTQIINKILKSNEELIVQVQFQPIETGNHVYTFEYEADDLSIIGIQTTFKGVGIVPRISTEDVDMGGSELSDFEHPVKNNIVVKNQNLQEWQFGDSVTITDILCKNINTDISKPWNEITESFKLDKSALTFPIILQPGEQLEIPVEFVANEMTQYSASITTVSDAETEITAIITGKGAEPGAVAEHNDKINIYPNPTEDILIIDKLPINTSKIQILDESGKEVKSIDIKNQYESFKISTRDLPIGNYILMLFVGGGVVDRKFVVVR